MGLGGGFLGQAANKIGGTLSSASNSTPLGKITNAAIGGMPGAIGSILQGKNPLANTPLGGILGQTPASDPLAGYTPAQYETPPSYQSILTPEGVLSDKYKIQAPTPINAQSVNLGQLDVNALMADPRALNAMRDKALMTGESPWLKMQLDKLALEQTDLRDRAEAEAMSGAAMARSQLGMKGGFTGGAGERIARQSSRDMNAARQQIGRQGMMAKTDLGIAEEGQKNALLNQVAGLDLSTAGQKQDLSKYNLGIDTQGKLFNAGQAADTDRFNTGMQFDVNKTNMATTLGDVNAQNDWQKFLYGEKTKQKGAESTARAIAAGGGSGSGPLSWLGIS